MLPPLYASRDAPHIEPWGTAVAAPNEILIYGGGSGGGPHSRAPNAPRLAELECGQLLSREQPHRRGVEGSCWRLRQRMAAGGGRNPSHPLLKHVAPTPQTP